MANLENEGVEMYDAQSQKKVLVVAPLMLIICDNPRAFELVNHLEVQLISKDEGGSSC